MKALAFCLMAALVLLSPLQTVLAEVLERPEVLAREDRIVHPVINTDNNIFRLLPRLYLAPGAMATPEEYDRLIAQFDVTFGLNVKDRGWYEPGGRFRRFTYCNYFSADVAQAMGAFLPGGLGCCPVCGLPRPDEFVAFYRADDTKASYRVDGMDNPIYADLHARDLLCVDKACSSEDVVYIHLSATPEESLNVWLHNHGTDFGWAQIVPGEGENVQTLAQQNADKGLLTIGAMGNESINHVFVLHPNVQGRTDGVMYLSEAGAGLRHYVAGDRPEYEYFSFVGYPDGA